MSETEPKIAAFSDSGIAARRHLGEAEHYRMWRVTEEVSFEGTPFRRFRRLEFDGWLVGWGGGISEVTNHVKRRFLESPTASWTAYVGNHESLETAETWLQTPSRAMGCVKDSGRRQAMAEEQRLTTANVVRERSA